MTFSRRDFISTSAAAIAASVLPVSERPSWDHGDHVIIASSKDLKEWLLSTQDFYGTMFPKKDAACMEYPIRFCVSTLFQEAFLLCENVQKIHEALARGARLYEILGRCYTLELR